MMWNPEGPREAAPEETGREAIELSVEGARNTINNRMQEIFGPDKDIDPENPVNVVDEGE